MSTSSHSTTFFFFFSISLFIFTLSLLFPSTDTYTMLARAPDGNGGNGNSNQQTMRQKLTPAQKTESEPENLRDFCTLPNFQKCISKLWPGSAAGEGGVNATTTASPVEGGSNKNSNQRKSSNRKWSAESSSAEATTTTTSSSSSGDPQQPTQQQLPPMTSSDLAFPTSYRELMVSCTDMKERVRCLDRHSELCFSPEMMQVFGHIVTNAKQFVHDLCDNKRVQTEYLIHAKCFRNISLDEQKCGQEYQKAITIPSSGKVESVVGASSSSLSSAQFIEKAQSLAESLPTAAKLVSAGQQAQEFQIKELIMRQHCCALQELVQCKRRHVREQCGESAAIFMRDHLPRITDPVLEQHCSAYTYGPGTCAEALYRQRAVGGGAGNGGSSGGGADGQQHLIATNPYHNPVDKKASLHGILGKKEGEGRGGEGSNRMIRNQHAEMHNNGSAGSRWTFGGNCSTVAIFFIYIVLLFRSSVAILSSFSCSYFI